MLISFTAAEIAAVVQPKRSAGSTSREVCGIAALGSAGPGDLSFLGNAKYATQVASTRASVVLLPVDHRGEPGPDQQFLFVDNPSVALARLCSRIEAALWPKADAGVHPSAVIAPGVFVPESATIGPLCVVEAEAVLGERIHLQSQVFVGRAARIGDDSWLMPGTVVEAECVLGQRVRLQPGVIVGSDGFGYEFVAGRHEKVPQVGSVLIGDDVEIGANSTVDRARFSHTRIGEGTKIDNLVQVGHNVEIGRHCIVCAQVGIGGSCLIGDYVIIGGQAGLSGHISIGSGVKMGAKTGVKEDIPPNTAIWGTPSMPLLLEQKLTILRNRLPELFKRVKELEAAVAELKGP